MKYPPKQSDLWRLANKLQLYGEEWDEEEQKAISFAWDGPALPSGIQIQAFSYVDVLDENIEIELPSPIRTEF